jgi:L-lactate utilization protein LutC
VLAYHATKASQDHSMTSDAWKEQVSMASRSGSQSKRLTGVRVIAVAVVSVVVFSSCSRTSNQELERQISSLERQLADSQDELQSTQADLVSAHAELATSQEKQKATQAELESTQAALLDAQAQLANVGELVLKDGVYQGPVLAAKVTPYRVILFDSTGAWRVAEVAGDAKITSGGKTLTLSQFAKLLQSTDPADIKLVNGFYKLKVQNGVVVTLQKSTK